MIPSKPPETGTLVIAALLLLVLGFAGYWIVEYADPNRTGRPWVLAEWFGIAALVIVVVGLLVFMRRGSGSGGR
jgi:hypothetical protein